MYDVLGLTHGASIDEVKKAYRKLAMIHHPDKGGNPEDFKKITQAYEILSDPEKKERFDQFGTTEPPPPQFQGVDISQMFSQMFGGGGGPGFNQRDMNRHHTIELTLEQVFTGITKTIRVPVMKPCPACATQCPKCRGQGVAVQEMLGMMGQMFARVCDHCEGCGIYRNGCPACQQQKRTVDMMNLQLNIPKGVYSGTHHVLQGLGIQARSPKEKTGNLVITFHVKTHALFERRGDDLRYVMTVSFRESVDGLDVTIPHFSGPVSFNTRQKFGILDPRKDYAIQGYGMTSQHLLLVNFDVQYPNHEAA